MEPILFSETRNTWYIKAGRILCVLPLLCLAILYLSCNGNHTSNTQSKGDTIALNYARNLTLVEYEGYTLASLRNPWDTTQTLHEYVLVERAQANGQDKEEVTRLAHDLHPQAEIVNVPLQHAAVFTAVHCALLQDLGAVQQIGGVADLDYIYLPFIQEGVKAGRIADVGNAMEPNLERIMELQPDALMPSPFQNSGGYGRLERIGIPIIECADYMEVSPLARAEWMKFYGRLFGCAERADSLFHSIEQEYLALCSQTAHVTHRPTLLAEKMSGASWYMPAGHSTMGILYNDAGAEYLWADSEESGSMPLSYEAVIDRALDADIWLFKYNQDHSITSDELLQDKPSYAEFKAFKQGSIYACNTRATSFYEETPFHPERLLGNLIQIFHPELSISAKKQYFCPLK